VAALVAFLVPVTLVFHNFWAYRGAEAQLQTIQFLKNVASGVAWSRSSLPAQVR
jgi:uncharacterized membrane protein YphA (DoxX/SURF4 family)